jgi:N-acetylglutamate synthase-like GNAT family acetyltransferase
MHIRAATPAEIPALEQLIAASARALGPPFYTAAETEAAITHVFGVDSELVGDGSYLVAERNGAIAGCGGWSRRATLFGGDRFQGRESGLLDPSRDAARIRAFFVAADHARQGVGDALLAACEAAARAAGFNRTALMATLPGQPFYAARGYVAQPAVTLDLGGIPVRFVPMDKHLA